MAETDRGEQREKPERDFRKEAMDSYVHTKRWKTQGFGGVVGKEDPVCRFQ